MFVFVYVCFGPLQELFAPEVVQTLLLFDANGNFVCAGKIFDLDRHI